MIPSMFQGESRTRLLQGAGFGVVATLVLGFGFGGWVLAGTAAQQSADGAKSAVAAVLAPICADNFRQAADASENLENFRKEAFYQQTRFVEKGGWAVLPGSKQPRAGVARACAELLRQFE